MGVTFKTPIVVEPYKFTWFDVEFPDPVFPERQPQDLRISSGSAAADAALLLPNINDGFTGEGPDIGAYEAGQPLPHYGPRPRGVDESSDGSL